MNKVTVLGSLNVDTILQIPRLPQPGETLAMTDQRSAGGGKGAAAKEHTLRLQRKKNW